MKRRSQHSAALIFCVDAVQWINVVYLNSELHPSFNNDKLSFPMVSLRLSSVFLFFAFFLVSCSSSTILNSEPSGAKIYVNESLRGTTPYPYSDTKIVGSSTRIKLVKEGYEDFHTIISRNEQVNVGAIIGGLFLLFPFLWTMDYADSYNWELVPKK